MAPTAADGGRRRRIKLKFSHTWQIFLLSSIKQTHTFGSNLFTKVAPFSSQQTNKSNIVKLIYFFCCYLLRDVDHDMNLANGYDFSSSFFPLLFNFYEERHSDSMEWMSSVTCSIPAVGWHSGRSHYTRRRAAGRSYPNTWRVAEFVWKWKERVDWSMQQLWMEAQLTRQPWMDWMFLHLPKILLSSGVCALLR